MRSGDASPVTIRPACPAAGRRLSGPARPPPVALAQLEIGDDGLHARPAMAMPVEQQQLEVGALDDPAAPMLGQLAHRGQHRLVVVQQADPGAACSA